MPRHVTAKGVKRTDAGMLGAGIYFADDVSASIKYTSAGNRGSRLMAIANVALGQCKDMYTIDSTLSIAPSGFSRYLHLPFLQAKKTKN